MSGYNLPDDVGECFCVRDRTGRIVVPWRPVGEVVAAIEGYADKREEIGMGEPYSFYAEPELPAVRSRLNALLGLEPTPDAGR